MEKLSSKIFLKGKEVAANIISIDIMTAVNKIPFAQVVIAEGEKPEEKALALSGLQCFKPGEVLTIKLSAKESGGVFKGIVVKHTIRKSADRTLLTIDIKHAVYKLSLVRGSAVFSEQTDLEIMNGVANPLGVEVECEEATLTHEKLVQYYCTPWDFILSRAEANGLMVCPDIEAEEPMLNLKPPVFSDSENELKDIFEYELEADLTNPYKEVEAASWNVESVTPQVQQAGESVPLEGLLGQLAGANAAPKSKLVSGIYAQAEELTAWANAALVKNNHSLLRGRVTVKGNAGIKLGSTVNFTSDGTLFHGKALVTGVRHRVDGLAWMTDIQCGLDNKWFYKHDDIVERPASGLLPGVQGLQIGIVEAYPADGDPAKFHRIQVRVPAVDEKESVLWARLLYPYAGNERGVFFVPEEGDEVVLGFFNDDPRHPVVLGALYNGSAAPPFELSEDNFTKAIITRNGVRLVMVDEDDKELLELSTPGGNIIKLEDENGITVQDKNENSLAFTDQGVKLEDKNKNIVTTDDVGITIEDNNKNMFILNQEGIKLEDANGNTIVLDSAGISITDLSGNTLALESGGASLESSGNVTVKGSAVETN